MRGQHVTPAAIEWMFDTCLMTFLTLFQPDTISCKMRFWSSHKPNFRKMFSKSMQHCINIHAAETLVLWHQNICRNNTYQHLIAPCDTYSHFWVNASSCKSCNFNLYNLSIYNKLRFTHVIDHIWQTSNYILIWVKNVNLAYPGASFPRHT